MYERAITCIAYRFLGSFFGFLVYEVELLFPVSVGLVDMLLLFFDLFSEFLVFLLKTQEFFTKKQFADPLYHTGSSLKKEELEGPPGYL
jgi:hypothetical protein